MFFVFLENGKESRLRQISWCLLLSACLPGGSSLVTECSLKRFKKRVIQGLIVSADFSCPLCGQEVPGQLKQCKNAEWERSELDFLTPGTDELTTFCFFVFNLKMFRCGYKEC